MKPKLWLVPLAFACTLSACENMLVEEPASFLTTDTYYRTPAELQAGVQAIYGSIQTTFPGGWNAWWAGLGLISDQEQVRQGARGAEVVTMSYMQYTAESPAFTSAGWQNLYRAIYRANLVLEKSEGVAMNEAMRDELIAEAKFLRAFSYFMLDKGYSAGPNPTDLSVPIVLSESDHLRADQIARATTAEVHALVLQDLLEAEAKLPTRTQRGAAGRGRATKGSAQAVLADLYLWRSSFMQTNEWQQAADWAKKVIDSGQYQLVQNGWFNIFNPSAKAANNELIFFLVASGNPGRQNSQYMHVYYPNELGTGSGGGFGTNVPTQWHLASYASGDIRGAVGQSHTPGAFPSDPFAYRNRACSTVATIGCRQLIETQVYKYRPTSIQPTEGDADIPLFRLAEMLLIYAEAQNELNQTATAIEYVNMVRARARLGATGTENRAEPADLPTSLTKQQARDAIYMERNWELAHEVKRWWDLVRRDSMEPGFWFNSLRQNAPHATARVPDLGQRTYLKRFPVPSREIDQAPILVQNPGY